LVGVNVGINAVVQNNVALNQSIINTSPTTGTDFGRVAGLNIATLNNNYGRYGMVIPINANPNSNGISGADVTLTQWHSANWWTTSANWSGGSGWDTSVWDIANDRLPRLRGMPAGEQNPHVRN
jgi:hypothetical protein